MAGLFISYRRDDSAGHAGRLFDALKVGFGGEQVFMDVSDLRPGQDFVAALDAALAKADCLLAVIGPRWLDATNAAGQRRINDPDDFVQREIGRALAQGATVIPVLVHGASMPAASALPPPLQPLARRQAITLTDPRWNSDVQELIALLHVRPGGAPRVAVPATGAPAARPGKLPGELSGKLPKQVGAAALLLATLVAGSWWLFTPGKPASQAPQAGSSNAPSPVASQAPGPPATGATATPAAPAAASAVARFNVPLPPLSEVRFRTSRAQLVFSIIAIRQEPQGDDKQELAFLVRMLNNGPMDEAFSSDQFRLVVAGQPIAPKDFLNDITNAVQARHATLRFDAPAGLKAAELEVRVNTESTRIPFALEPRTALRSDPTLDDFGRAKPVRLVDVVKAFPAALPAGQRVALGPVGYQIVAVNIERETVEKASLTVTVRCSVPLGGVAVNFWSDTLRLWLDGLPHAPVNFVNEAVSAGDSKEARFVFELSAMPSSMELSVRNSSESSKFALPLDALPRR